MYSGISTHPIRIEVPSICFSFPRFPVYCQAGLGKDCIKPCKNTGKIKILSLLRQLTLLKSCKNVGKMKVLTILRQLAPIMLATRSLKVCKNRWKMQAFAHVEASCSLLPFWSYLVAFLVHLRPILGSSLGQLGAILGHLGAILGASWGHLGTILGPSWGRLGPSWAILRLSWGPLV